MKNKVIMTWNAMDRIGLERERERERNGEKWYDEKSAMIIHTLKNYEL